MVAGRAVAAAVRRAVTVEGTEAVPQWTITPPATAGSITKLVLSLATSTR